MTISLLFCGACCQKIDGFESWSAQEKSQAIWDRIEESKGRNSWWFSPFKSFSLPFLNYDLTFERTDFMQYTWWSLWLFPRWKAIHTVGAVQQIRWVPESGQPYTGIFKGASHGLVRYSTGSEPNLWDKGSLLPGMALKFFRSGVHSASMHAI